MMTISEWDAFQALIGSVSRGHPGYTTNLYAGREQIETWCAHSPLPAIVTDNAVLVLRPDHDFHHVYHAAQEPSSLIEALLQLQPGSYSTDLVGRPEDIAPVSAAYAAGGFSQHAYLRRMNRPPMPFARDEGTAEAARVEDVPIVAAFLERLLDRFSEQLPTHAQLAAAVAAGQLLVVRRENGIAGMLMFDLKGQLAHLRFWHVDADIRSKGVGRELMAGFLSRCAQARRVVLWVLGDNSRSIEIYRHYGFAEDGLLDQIMTLNKDLE